MPASVTAQPRTERGCRVKGFQMLGWQARLLANDSLPGTARHRSAPTLLTAPLPRRRVPAPALKSASALFSHAGRVPCFSFFNPHRAAVRQAVGSRRSEKSQAATRPLAPASRGTGRPGSNLGCSQAEQVAAAETAIASRKLAHFAHQR
jgi:hypothetical protein